ncbi:hypothetical protein FA15DRAFT_155041 [Coprinopsis marcescibilis]|uniref:Ras modification protein ERF4 n=1 Tax=Coprinopsis marcescibilis TaxID=230819 RepID=A0A5C3KIM7_COPMA|nr:hypothetical protein FA15DRAFT_155041 [Coprinopsis marcescibilis]
MTAESTAISPPEAKDEANKGIEVEVEAEADPGGVPASSNQSEEDASTTRESAEDSLPGDRTLVASEENDMAANSTAEKTLPASSAQHTRSGSKSSDRLEGAATDTVHTTTKATTAAMDYPVWDPTSSDPLKNSFVSDLAEKRQQEQQQTQDTTLVAGDQTQDATMVANTLAEKEEDEEDVADSSQFLKPDGGHEPGHPTAVTGGATNGSANDLSLPIPSPVPSRRPSALQLKPPSPQPWDLIPPPGDNMKRKGLGVGPSIASNLAASQQRSPNGRPLVPKSSYYFGPPGPESAYGTPPMGRIGIHHPREILRVERDYTGGEVIQFAPIYPLELENRITPTQFLESMNTINETLISAHSLRHAFLDNLVSVVSLQLSRLVMSTHFEKEMKRLRTVINDLNVMIYNPVGLNILWPGDVAFLFLEIEYY